MSYLNNNQICISACICYYMLYIYTYILLRLHIGIIFNNTFWMKEKYIYYLARYWYCLTNWLVILLFFFTWQYSVSVYFLEWPLCGEHSFLYILLNICSVGRQYDKYPWSFLSSALWTTHVKNMVSLLHWCIYMLEAPSFCLSLSHRNPPDKVEPYWILGFSTWYRGRYAITGPFLLSAIQLRIRCLWESCYKVVVHICSAKTVWWPLILECWLLKYNYSVDTDES